MIKKYCDKCGEEISMMDGRVQIIQKYEIRRVCTNVYPARVDLCYVCQKDFDNWLNRWLKKNEVD